MADSLIIEVPGSCSHTGCNKSTFRTHPTCFKHFQDAHNEPLHKDKGKKTHGICSICKTAEVTPGLKTCTHCRYRNSSKKFRSARRKEAGKGLWTVKQFAEGKGHLCFLCLVRPPMEGPYHNTCEQCETERLEKEKKREAKKAEKAKAKRKKRSGN
ncbi:hypothetical protein B0T16DRAFT_395555 [Cercophora newfieldiana]|uniref:Uncharacterized protein n=1 Tax=Cercophora newfieldiana TaxID=92897 RepID=A0AA40CIC4_9PEZI|nr:hypothetical protein B0T16DRAFT_395555 [Cercophora newfieldiana]